MDTCDADLSDLTYAKRRPALVIAELEGDDLILCQITSQQIRDRYAVLVEDNDFETGTLKQKSNVRPNRIFTYCFLIVIEKANNNYSAYSPDLPGCVATGAPREEAEKNMYEAIEMHIQGLLEDKCQ